MALGTWSSQRISPGKISSGTIEAGKPADLDVNPVADVRTVRRIRTLAIGGKLLKRGDLYAAANHVTQPVRARLE